MKKQILSIAVAALLAMGAFGLAACNGSGSGSAASSSASSKAPEKTPEERVLGEWNLAAAEIQGATVAGDLAGAIGFTEFTLVVDEESFEMTSDGQTEEGTWELDGDTKLVLTNKSGDPVTLEYNEDNGSLYLDMSEIQSRYEGMSIVFTNDDSTYEAVLFDMDDVEDIADFSDYVGDWSITGFYLAGASVSGEVANYINGDFSLTIDKDGTGTMNAGSNTVKVTIESNGGGSIMKIQGTELPLGTLDGKLVVIADEIYGVESMLIFE